MHNCHECQSLAIDIVLGYRFRCNKNKYDYAIICTSFKLHNLKSNNLVKLVISALNILLKMQGLRITWRQMTNNVLSLNAVTKLRNTVKAAFSDKFLLYTNVTISITLSSFGDLIEQTYEIYTKEQDKYDPRRTVHMAFSGAALGVLCHHWYKALDKFIVGKTFDMVAKKLFLDQMLFSPIMIITFFGSLALFEKNPVKDFKEEVESKFVTLYKAEWMVWPPAQIINFYFLPSRYRVLYDNTISLGYDVYTSQVKHNKSLRNLPQDKNFL